jgi:hypothetical protein
MSPLQGWLHRQAARERRIVALEEGLIGGRLWSYSLYRLRYFFLAYLVESAGHAVTVLLLFKGLAWDNFLLVVVAHAGTMLVASLWWGALEQLRGQVRELHRSGRTHRIPSAIGGWLTFAVIVAAAVLALALGWTVWCASRGRFGVTEAYVAALLLRLALGLPTGCYHSGVYALRRVYKPLPATLAPELLGLAMMLAFWPVAGVWALVVSSLVVTVAVNALSLHYTHRVYRFLRFEPLRQTGRRALRAALRGAGRESLAAGVSHAVMALDSLVVLALLYGAQTDSESLVVLFLAAPTIRAGVDWGRLLYFDLKRLELRLFTNLRRRFELHTALLASLLGLVFWAFAAGIATAFYGRGLGSLYGALLAFFVARSVLARAQMQAYAARAYAAVVGTGVLCVAGLAAVAVVAQTEAQRLAAVAAITGLSAVALDRLARFAQVRAAAGTALVPLEWLGRLAQVHDAVRVGSARVIETTGPERLDARSRAERNRWRLGRLAERTARRLGRPGAATWVAPDRVVWFETSCDGAPSGPRVTVEWLQRVSGGLIAEVQSLDCGNGAQACSAAGHGQLLGRASRHLLAASDGVDAADARRMFDELVPGGIVYSPDAPVPPALAELPKSELRAILCDATAFARDLDVGRPRSHFDVSALCGDGELRLIFIAHPHCGRSARARWRERVTELNVRAAIGAAPQRHSGDEVRPARRKDDRSSIAVTGRTGRLAAEPVL